MAAEDGATAAPDNEGEKAAPPAEANDAPMEA
jgi:hypothetical protein